VLVVGDGDQARRHPLPARRCVVGRANDCDIVLDHVSVSRQHAALVVSFDEILLVDLGSRNGTSLNGREIREARAIPGDRIIFGSVEASVDFVAGEEFTVVRPKAVRRLGDFPGTDQLSAVEAPRLIRLLAEVARALVGTLTLPEILARVVDLLFTNIRAERACLLMIDGATGTLVPTVARRADGGAAEGAMVSRTAIDTAIDQRAAIIAIDARVDGRFGSSASIQLEQVSSLMCAPLFTGDRLMGALYADNGLANQFSEADLEVFTALANYAAVAIGQAALADQLAEERRRRERLQRYHSPAVVDRILARQVDDLLAVEERDISVLFADIVDFTTLAESMRPADAVALLDTFLARTGDAVFAEEGTIDKFIGDAILAVFGAPVEQSDHARRAVRAAQSMRRIVSALNAERSFPPLRVRYVVNSGVAIAGDIGPARRKEYTVLGDVVNIGSRLKAVAEPDQLVVSRATYDRIQPPLPATLLGEFAMRGRTSKIEVLSIDP
jgi:adenylate cyclase